jgi:hypothetical protein
MLHLVRCDVMFTDSKPWKSECGQEKKTIFFLCAIELEGPFSSSIGFVTVDFYMVGLLAPHLSHNLEDQALQFVWPRPFDPSGMVDPTRSFCSCQHTSAGHWGIETSPQ